MCKHLQPLIDALLSKGIKMNSSGKAWSNTTGTWKYFDCYLNNKTVRKRFALPEFIHDHEHLGTHDGQESGFICMECDDAVMGVHKEYYKRYEYAIFK